MNELNLTHAFVRNLTKGLRDEFGNGVKHTDVLKVVAAAAGQNAGAMMHRLKAVAASEGMEASVETPAVLSQRSSFSWPLIGTLLKAASDRDMRTFGLVRGALSTKDPFVKYVFAISARYLVGRSKFGHLAEPFLLAAFLQDDLWLRYATQSLTAVDLSEELHAFGGESYGATFTSEMLTGGILPREMRTWTGLMAVRFGFVRFEGALGVLVPYDLDDPNDKVAITYAGMRDLVELVRSDDLGEYEPS